MEPDFRKTLSRSSDREICWNLPEFGARGGVAGGTWWGGGEAVMGDRVCGESGFDGMGSGSGHGMRGYGSEGGRWEVGEGGAGE